MPYTFRHLTTTEGSSNHNNKRLSICLQADGFSFAETTAEGQLLSLGEVEGSHPTTITTVAAEVKSTLAKANIRPLGYKQMELVAISDENVWIPDELYISSSARHYLSLVGSNALSAATCHSDTLNATAIFVADEQTLMGFKVALPGLVVTNQHVKMANLAPRSINHPILVCNFRGGKIDVAVLKKRQYVMGNTLQVSGIAEARFRLVEIMKAFEIDTDNTELMLCGEVDRSKYAMLQPYFPKLTLFAGDVTQYNKELFASVPRYQYALILF